MLKIDNKISKENKIDKLISGDLSILCVCVCDCLCRYRFECWLEKRKTFLPEKKFDNDILIFDFLIFVNFIFVCRFPSFVDDDDHECVTNDEAFF